MPINLSDRLSELLGYKNSEHDGISPQTKKQLIELDNKGKIVPPPTPEVSKTQGGSFEEDFRKNFGDKKWELWKKQHDGQKEKLLKSR